MISWSIKILKSNNDGYGIYIGVAPSNISQNEWNYNKCGWYFDCYSSKLYSGLLTTTMAKSMDQGKKTDNTSTQETVWVL